MTKDQDAAREYAEKHYPTLDSRIFNASRRQYESAKTSTQEHFLAGISYADSRRWIPVSERLPDEKSTKWHESEYVLGIEHETGYPLPCWYNHESKKWFMADHRFTVQEVFIKWWQPLPAPPQNTQP